VLIRVPAERERVTFEDMFLFLYAIKAPIANVAIRISELTFV